MLLSVRKTPTLTHTAWLLGLPRTGRPPGPHREGAPSACLAGRCWPQTLMIHRSMRDVVVMYVPRKSISGWQGRCLHIPPRGSSVYLQVSSDLIQPSQDAGGRGEVDLLHDRSPWRGTPRGVYRRHLGSGPICQPSNGATSPRIDCRRFFYDIQYRAMLNF